MSEKCKGCGSEIEYSAGSQSLKCPYCGAINEIKKEEDALPDEVELIIPLSITADDLEKEAYGYMASGNYTPDDMLEAATFIKRKCFYVPAFLFRVDYEATWTASFGYERKEPYTAYKTVTSNGNSRQEAYTAYRTVTDWRPANGVDAGILSVSTYAGTALRESDLSPADLVPIAIAGGNATNFNASFMKGVEAESFVVPEAAAYTSLADEINGKIDGSVKSHAQGNHQKDWHWNAKMSHSSSTLYVPIGHAVFDYQGTDYHFWIDGIGQAQIRADKLPEDMERKKVVQVGFVPAGIAGVCLMATSYLWGFTWAGLVAAAILGGYAAIRRKSIFGYSQSIRESLLTQIQASASSTRQLSSEEQQKLAFAFQRPEKSFFAKTHLDRILLPSLSVAALLGVCIPSYLVSPGYMEGSSRGQAEARESASEVVPTAAPVAVQVAPVERSDVNVPAVVSIPTVQSESATTASGSNIQPTSVPEVKKVILSREDIEKLETEKGYSGDDPIVRERLALAATSAPARRDPQQLCEVKTNFISRSMCETRLCKREADMKDHPYCVELLRKEK